MDLEQVPIQNQTQTVAQGEVVPWNQLPVKGPTPQTDHLSEWLADPLKALPHVQNDISEDTYLRLNTAWTERRIKLNSEMYDGLEDLLSGRLQETLEKDAKATEEQIDKILSELSTPLQLRPSELKKRVGEDIQRMEHELETGDFARRINPETGENYTQQEWADEVKWARKHAFIEAGLDVNPNEAGAVLLAQLLDPENARSYYGAHRQLQEERLKVYQDDVVRAWDQKQKIQTLRLQRLSQMEGWLRERAEKDLDRQDAWRRAIWENNQNMDRFQQQIQNGNWQLAIREANDVLSGIGSLHPNLVEGALQRYNNMARFANSLKDGGTEPLQIFEPEQVNSIVNEAERRQRESIIAKVNDDIYKFKSKWENMTPDDIKGLNSYLRTFGPLFNPNTGKKEVLTADDVALAAGFNRLTPRTQEAVRHNQQTEKNTQSRTQSQERIANQNNQTRIGIAAQNNATRVSTALLRVSQGDSKEVEKLKKAAAAAQTQMDSLSQSILSSDPQFDLEDEMGVEDPDNGKKFNEYLKARSRRDAAISKIKAAQMSEAERQKLLEQKGKPKPPAKPGLIGNAIGEAMKIAKERAFAPKTLKVNGKTVTVKQTG